MPYLPFVSPALAAADDVLAVELVDEAAVVEDFLVDFFFLVVCLTVGFATLSLVVVVADDVVAAGAGAVVAAGAGVAGAGAGAVPCANAVAANATAARAVNSLVM
jgi:hypothetical protein